MKKNKKNKYMFINIIVIIIIVIAITLLIKNNVRKNENKDVKIQSNEFNSDLIDMNNNENADIKDGVKENNSKTLLSDKEFKGLKIQKVRLKAENGMSSYTATIVNNTGTDYQGEEIVLKFINKDGSPYAELNAFMPDVKNGTENTINAFTTADVANAYDYTIEVK